MRSALISELANSPSSRPGYIYRSSEQAESGAARPNSITVFFSVDWPRLRGQPITVSQIRENNKLMAAVVTIQRAKDYLERQLLEEIRVWDIKPGCIRVRYLLPDGISRANVGDAIRALSNLKDSFDVTDVSAHVDGREITK